MKRSTARLLGAVVGVVLGIAVMLVVANLASTGDVEVRLGDEDFTVGDAEVLAAAVERDDQPLLFQDLLGEDLDVWVNHVEEDPLFGWVAFDARRPDQPRDCILEWDRDADAFVDPCDGTVVPADGGDQPSYPTRVTEDGDVVVAFRSPTTPAR